MTLWYTVGPAAAITLLTIFGLRFLVVPREEITVRISKVELKAITLEGLSASEFLKIMDKNQPFEEFDSEDEFDCESRMDVDVNKYLEPQRKVYKFLGKTVPP